MISLTSTALLTSPAADRQAKRATSRRRSATSGVPPGAGTGLREVVRAFHYQSEGLGELSGSVWANGVKVAATRRNARAGERLAIEMKI